MEKNKKIGIMMAVIAVLIITVLGAVYYFTEIKVDENGFNSHGVRKLKLDRESSWNDIELGTYILEIDGKYNSSEYSATVREKQFEDYYEEKLKKFKPFTNNGMPVGDYYYRDTITFTPEGVSNIYKKNEIDSIVKKEIEDGNYGAWKNKYIFKDVEIKIEIEFSYIHEIYNSLEIMLNEDGTIKRAFFYASDSDLEKIMKEKRDNRFDHDFSIEINLADIDGYNYTIKSISGSVERQ